jgi:hypothetical protein
MQNDLINSKIKVGDIVGNTVQGFEWEVLEIDGNYFVVKNKNTKEIIKTFSENMYHPRNKMAKGGKIEKALYNIDKWMPEDFELQREYYQLINDKDQKGMEEFLDMYADQDRLMRYGIQYEDLGKLSEAIISGSNYAKGGKTSDIKAYLETLDASQIFDLCDDFYTEDEDWHEIKNDLDKDELIEYAYDYCKKNKISVEDLKNISGSEDYADGGMIKLKSQYKFIGEGATSAVLRSGYGMILIKKGEVIKVTKLNPDGNSDNVVANFEGDAILISKEKLLNDTMFEKIMADGGYMAKGGMIVAQKTFDINDNEVSEDIYEFLLDYTSDGFELSEEDQYAIRSEDPERVIDIMNDGLIDYEVVSRYDDDLIRLKIQKKMKMENGGNLNAKYIAYIEESRRPGGSDRSIKKTYNLDVEDRTSDGFYIAGAKEDIEDFINDYSINFAKIELYKEDGNMMARGGKTSGLITINLDANFEGDGTQDVKKYIAKLERKFKIKIKPTGKSYNIATQDYLVTGKKEDILTFLADDSYDEDEFGMGFANDEIEEFFPELFEDGGDIDELDAEMEKLVLEHNKEAKRNRVKITNFGWSQGDDYIVSKTTERKDGSDVLTSEISNGVVEHDWDSYARGGKLKSNAAKFRDKVKAISKKLTGTKVPKKYKKDYGATYDKQEANTAARRISGAKLAELRAKLAKKTKTKRK